MKQHTSIFKILSVMIIVALSSGAAAGIASAQTPASELEISLDYEISCAGGEGEVEFTISWEPAEAESYLYYVDFDDGDTTGLIPTTETTVTLTHSFVDQGEYQIYVEVFEVVEIGEDGGSGSLEYILTLEGPEVDLISIPSPPVFVVGESGQVLFTAETTGGTIPYSYTWDLGGGASQSSLTSDSASATYSEVGVYTVNTTVTDGCGFSATAAMSVVVADPEEACHPMAQKIADGVSSLFPDQAGEEYTCEDIYTMFDNPDGDNNLGFGRMWMAYHLAETIDLSWEEILGWKMDQSGWGSLLQLNRFAETLSEQGIGDLMALVMSEEYTLADVRTAVRSVARFEADFEDALVRIAAGASAGELSQFYGLAAELGADYETLDGYLADGMTLSELKHAASFAAQMEVDWAEIADFRSLYGDSWGDLKQAYSMATDEYSPGDILAMGVQEFRKEQTSEKQEDKTAQRLAEQYGADLTSVMGLFEGVCEGKWSCVRKALRDGALESGEGLSEKDNKTALQIGAKYGFDEGTVTAHYLGACEMDWSCTRAYFREIFMDSKETGKPE